MPTANGQMLVTVDNNAQLDDIIETLRACGGGTVQVMADADTNRSVLINTHGTGQGTLPGPVKLKVTGDIARMQPMAERFNVTMEELVTNALGVTEAMSAYRHYYTGAKGAALADDDWMRQLLEAGYALTPWEELDDAARADFIDIVNLYSAGELFLSPEIVAPASTLAEAAAVHAQWMMPPAA